MTNFNFRISSLSTILFSLLSVVLLCLALAGCGNDEKDPTAKSVTSKFPVSVEGKVGKMTEKNGKRSMIVNATAYTLRPSETKEYAVGVAAWGDRLKPGMKVIAVSRDLIPLGLGHNVEVVIRGLPGTYRVLDKMNKRWKHKIDILFADNVARAEKWGKRKVVITWPAPKK